MVTTRGLAMAAHAPRRIGPLTIGARTVAVVQRVIAGIWHDGFIHAGNLAYMSLLALFPFCIVVGAGFAAVGKSAESAASVRAFLRPVPHVVANAIEPVALAAINARHGWLLWAGAAVGLWTVSSLIETIRDILRRAYGCPPPARGWWRYRLLSGGIIVLAVVLLLASLYAQIAITAAQVVIAEHFHRHIAAIPALRITRAVPVAVLFLAMYLLFFALTPAQHRSNGRAKWPGALLVTVWWGIVSILLPLLLHRVFAYDLTYGSLAGVMIALFFFWLVGLGVVTGAELNAAIAIEAERDAIGQADDEARTARHRQDEQREASE